MPDEDRRQQCHDVIHRVRGESESYIQEDEGRCERTTIAGIHMQALGKKEV